jgi:hypothetical protein
MTKGTPWASTTTSRKNSFGLTWFGSRNSSCGWRRKVGLLVSPADLQKILGELRQKLFAWEIRCSRHLGQADDTDDTGEGQREGTAAGEGPDASMRVVREALERQKQMIREWSGEADRESDD